MLELLFVNNLHATHNMVFLKNMSPSCINVTTENIGYYLAMHVCTVKPVNNVGIPSKDTSIIWTVLIVIRYSCYVSLLLE